MSKVHRNKPCSCGSGLKYKRCCGATVQIMLPEGVDGLERPDPIPVEASFNEFVVELGGQLVSDLMPATPSRPLNADYYFPVDGVIVELKCFEKNLFNCYEDVPRILSIIERHRDSGAVSGYKGLRWVLGQEHIPQEYRRDMLSLARRHIEDVIRKADKQIRSTKALLNLPNARGLVLLANDGNYFSHPAEAVALICQVMQEHFLESSVDGFVYFTVNVVAKAPGTDRELAFWIPVYRKEGDEVGSFVNRLGSEWNSFYARKVGQDMPKFQSEDMRILMQMRLFNE